MPNWVEQEAKRNARNLLIVGLVILAIGGVLMYLVYDEATRRFAHDEAQRQSASNVMYVLGAVMLFALVLCVNSLRRMSEIQATPVWKQVAEYGDVEQIAAHIAQEEQMDS